MRRLGVFIVIGALGVVPAHVRVAQAAPVAVAANPCAAIGGTEGTVGSMRAEGRRLLPAAVWKALEAAGYYICTVSHTSTGKLEATSFRLPIGSRGQRVHTRLLFELKAAGEARLKQAEIRRDHSAFMKKLGGGRTDPGAHFESVRAIGRFLVVGVSVLRL
jgi:hypothetical protein